MGRNWNDFSESEKEEMRNKAASVAERASAQREEIEARKGSDGGSFLDGLLGGMLKSLERTANNISQRK